MPEEDVVRRRVSDRLGRAAWPDPHNPDSSLTIIGFSVPTLSPHCILWRWIDILKVKICIFEQVSPDGALNWAVKHPVMNTFDSRPPKTISTTPSRMKEDIL